MTGPHDARAPTTTRNSRRFTRQRVGVSEAPAHPRFVHPGKCDAISATLRRQTQSLAIPVLPRLPRSPDLHGARNLLRLDGHERAERDELLREHLGGPAREFVAIRLPVLAFVGPVVVAERCVAILGD